MIKLNNLRKAVMVESLERQKRDIEALGSDFTLECFSTPTRWANYKAGKASREDTAQYAISRIARAVKKDIDKKLADIKAAEENTVEIKEITITVKYAYSRTWGYKPQVTAQIMTSAGYKAYHDSASGGRYDKTSAAVASALNQDPTLRAYLYRAKESRMENGSKMPYGSGHGALPYIEGATGMSTVESVLNACSFGIVNTIETKNGIVYTFKRERKEEDRI